MLEGNIVFSIITKTAITALNDVILGYITIGAFSIYNIIIILYFYNYLR